MNIPATEAGRIPALTSEEMAAVDRVLIDGVGVDVLQLMETAGRAVAAFARERFLGGDATGKRVLVLAGSGNNGGDGLVAARYLQAWGAAVSVRLGTDPSHLGGPAAHQHRALVALGVPMATHPPSVELGSVDPEQGGAGASSAGSREGAGVAGEPADALPAADVMIDALLGFGLTRAPAGSVGALVAAANAQPAPTLAVDVPSGLDATSGTVFNPCVRAAATLTLALPKVGLRAPAARAVVGELYLADIGVPASVYARLGHAVGPIFARASTLRLD